MPGKAKRDHGAITRDRVERDEAQARKEMLPDLANLTDNSTGRFRGRYHYDLPEDDASLLQYRNQLQQFWSHADGTDWALALWLREATRESEQAWELRSFPDRLYGVVPNYSVFSLSLAIGASELASKMAVCANPECQARYFLKGRRTQRFCDIRACAAYGQREHARKWWAEHGEEWRRKRERARKSRAGRRPASKQRKGGR